MGLKQKFEPNETHSEGQRDQLKIVIVGHVDHGKSTLIGRLFYDTDSLPEGRHEQIRDQCQRRGMPFEWSFLMDSLQAERDQGITIDTTQISFRTNTRDYMIIDAPGHKEFLKNMISGAASSEAALLVIDANEGVCEQSKRHGYILHLLGVKQIAVMVNKMDLVAYSEARFEEIKAEYLAYLREFGVKPRYVIPISAMRGDGIVSASPNMPWFGGASVLEALDGFRPRPKSDGLPLRMPVQDIYKFDDRRIIVGRIESGRLRVGDEVLFSPSNKLAHVASFERWAGYHANGIPQQEAGAEETVGITLSEPIFVERGNLISHQESSPTLSYGFKAKIFWLGDSPLTVGDRFRLKINTTEHPVEVSAIERVVNTDDLSTVSTAQVEKNGVAEIILRSKGLLSLDEFSANPFTGRFVLVDGYRIVGGGTTDLEGFANLRRNISIKSTNLHPTNTGVDPHQRSIVNGHLGGVLWFTGLPSSGKTTLALELQRELFVRGYQVFVLDGDNIRSRLNADLGFQAQDRTENIRRVGEVAALFAEAGMIIITAFISPYHDDRERARLAVGERFHCVFIDADVETCERRDPHGLWEKMRRGEIQHFTGVDDPYEIPVDPEMVVNTRDHTIEECLAQLIEYATTHFVQPLGPEISA